MSLEDKLEEKGSRKGIMKALGGIGLLLHSAFHLVPLLGFGYLALGGESPMAHSHEGGGILHYALDFMGIGFAIWGIYYAYQGIKEYFAHRKHGHDGYHSDYAH